MSAGKINHEVLSILMANCRIPELNWGDIKAQLAGLNTAERRIHDLVDRYGSDVGARRHRRRARLRRGSGSPGHRRYAGRHLSLHDYLEIDHVINGRLQRIKLALTVKGSDIILDFTGTDPQVQAAFNMATGGKNGHWMISFSLVSVLRTLAPDMILNSGAVRPMKYISAQGEHAQSGATRLLRRTRRAFMFRVFDAILGALGQALPDKINAAGSNQGSILLVSVPDPRPVAPRSAWCSRWREAPAVGR